MRMLGWLMPMLAITLVACGKPADTQTQAEASAGLPQVVVTSAWLPTALVRDGVVEAVQQTTLAAQTSARVLALPFDVNDSVKKGDVLVQLTDTEQQAAVAMAVAQVAQTKAALAEAESAYKRVQLVHGRGLTSAAQLDQARSMRDQAKAGVAAADAQLIQARRQLAYTRVTAPFDGVIRQRFVEVGQAVQSGPPQPQPLIALQHAALRVQLVLAESDAERLKDRPAVQVQAADGRWQATDDVTVFPYADPHTHTVTVRLNLPVDAQGFYPGMSVKVAIATENRQQLVVPVSALVKRGELVGVYVLTNQRPLLRQVRVGQQQGDKVAVLAGLSQGDRVITDPQAAVVWLMHQRNKPGEEP